MLIRSCARGVTLIELMVGLAVLAILLTAGLPSYSTWIYNWRIRVAAESMVNGLQLARTEAVRRNTDVAFALGPASDWRVLAVATDETIQARSAAEGSSGVEITVSPETATTVAFDSLGRVANAGGEALARIDVAVPERILPAGLSRPLRISVSPGGQVRMCDPSVSEAADPRRC
jgi:type IV fimbrial biogenesis protein FimT